MEIEFEIKKPINRMVWASDKKQAQKKIEQVINEFVCWEGKTEIYLVSEAEWLKALGVKPLFDIEVQE